MSCGKPNWQLLLDCVQGLTAAEVSPFTRQDLIRCVQSTHPSALEHSLNPTIQGMTANAPGGPPQACGTPLRRVGRAQYVLTDAGMETNAGQFETPRRRLFASAPPVSESKGLEALERLELERTLVVLPCSASKRHGGEAFDSQAVPRIVDLLPPDLGEELTEARARVAARATVDETHLLPAAERYRGYLYQAVKPHLRELIARAAGVVILSGGYGAVMAEEPIGEYDLALKPADWSEHLLGRVLAAAARALRVEAVLAFLSRSTAYAGIVRGAPWEGGGPWVGLVTPETGTGGAMVTAPRTLGEALVAWAKGELGRDWMSGDSLGLRLEVLSEGREL